MRVRILQGTNPLNEMKKPCKFNVVYLIVSQKVVTNPSGDIEYSLNRINRNKKKYEIRL